MYHGRYERHCGPEDGKECCEMLSSGCDNDHNIHEVMVAIVTCSRSGQRDLSLVHQQIAITGSKKKKKDEGEKETCWEYQVEASEDRDLVFRSQQS